MTTQKLEIDYACADKFLSGLDPNAEFFDFRAIWPKEKPLPPGVLPQFKVQKVKGLLSDRATRSKLANLNLDGYGIYVTINATDGDGVKAENIIGIRAVWADWDDGIPEIELPLPPSCVLNTSPGRYQAFWFLDKNGMSERQFASIMDRIVATYGGDKHCKDKAHVLRVPGFFHTKREPYLANIARFEGATGSEYSADEVQDAFPPLQRTSTSKNSKRLPPALTAISKRVSRSEFDRDRDKVMEALEHIHECDPSYVDDRATWIEVGMALHHASGGDLSGYTTWADWSELSDKFDGPECERTWRSFGKNSPGGRQITLGTIFDRAKRLGWRAYPVKVTELGELEVRDYPKLNGNKQPDKESMINIQHFIDKSGMKVWYDEFGMKSYVEFAGRPRVIDDVVLSEIRFAMHANDLKAGSQIVQDGLLRAARQSVRHPVREYLNGLKWDGKRRIDKVLITYCGAADTPLNRAYGRKFMIGAVRRIMKPGGMMRTMLVLEGPQGAGKSSFFRVLAVKDEWFTDNLEIGAGTREVMEQTSGKWFVEFAELSGMQRKEVEAVKAFISRTTDHARLSYGRFATEAPRQFVLTGTTNDQQYLKDKTGNTRFWGVRISEIDLKALEEDAPQLWAEAVHIERTGEEHWLTDPSLIAQAELSAERRTEVSPTEQLWLDLLTDAPDCFLPSEELWLAAGFKTSKERTTSLQKLLGTVAGKAGWVQKRKRVSGGQPYGYVPCSARDIGALPIAAISVDRRVVTGSAVAQVHRQRRSVLP